VDAFLAASTPAPGAAPEAGAPHLRFPWGAIPLTATGLTIGRDFPEHCGAEIEEFSNVSRRHAQIRHRDGRLFVEDQASTNGTTVNGRPIAPYQPQQVVDGDVIGFGSRLRVVVVCQKVEP